MKGLFLLSFPLLVLPFGLQLPPSPVYLIVMQEMRTVRTQTPAVAVTLQAMRTVWDQPSVLLPIIPPQRFPHLSPLSEQSCPTVQRSHHVFFPFFVWAHGATNSRPHFTPTFRASQHDRKLRRWYTHQPPPFWGILNTSLSIHSKTARPLGATTYS